MAAGNDGYEREEQKRLETIGIYILGLIAVYATFRSSPDVMRELNVWLVGEEAYELGVRMTGILDIIMLGLGAFCLGMVVHLFQTPLGGGWIDSVTKAFSGLALLLSVLLSLLFIDYVTVRVVMGTGNPSEVLAIAVVLTAILTGIAILVAFRRRRKRENK